MPTKKEPFTFHSDENILLKIKKIAKHETRSTSNLIEHLCKRCVIEFEEKYGEVIINDLDEE